MLQIKSCSIILEKQSNLRRVAKHENDKPAPPRIATNAKLIEHMDMLDQQDEEWMAKKE